MTAPSPGPAPDRAAADSCDRVECRNIALHSDHYRQERDSAWDGYAVIYAENQGLRAELDRQRALIAAVLAECERYERGGDVIMRTGRIRALLGREER